MKWLLYKHSELISDPQYSRKMPGLATYIYNLNVGMKEAGGSLWLAGPWSELNQWAPGPLRAPVSKAKVGSNCRTEQHQSPAFVASEVSPVSNPKILRCYQEYQEYKGAGHRNKLWPLPSELPYPINWSVAYEYTTHKKIKWHSMQPCGGGEGRVGSL